MSVVTPVNKVLKGLGCWGFQLVFGGCRVISGRLEELGADPVLPVPAPWLNQLEVRRETGASSERLLRGPA